MYILKAIWLLLLVAGLSNCDEEICPAPADIYPCNCYDFSLGLDVYCDGSNNVISIEELQKLVKNLSGKKIKSFSLRLSNMEQASSELLNGLAIQEVNLYETNITKVPAFKGSENTLQELFILRAISEESIQNFTLKVSHLNKLKSLFLENNYYCYVTDKFMFKTISVGNDCFENGPFSLEKVSLYGNEIKSFGDRIFSELVNLKEIDLGWNRMEEVHRSMFPDPAERLLSIDLQHNELESLPENIFSNMPVLDRLDVSDNKISVLNERTWRPVWEQLDSLILGSNLTCDSTISWTFKLRRPNHLEGMCGNKSFIEYDGKSLAEIIDQNQSLSSNKN